MCCCIRVSVCVCDSVLCFCLNYGNMPKICFSLWGLPSNLFSFAFSLCLLLVYGFYRASTLSLCCPLFWPIFRLLLLLLLSLWLRTSNFKRAMKRLLYFIYNTYTYICIYFIWLLYVVVYANFLLLSFRLCSTVPHLFNGIFIS